MPLRADRMDASTRERRSLWRTPRAAGPFVCVAAIAVAGIIGMHLPPEEAGDVRRRIPTDVELLVRPGTVVDLCR